MLQIHALYMYFVTQAGVRKHSVLSGKEQEESEGDRGRTAGCSQVSPEPAHAESAFVSYLSLTLS